jgi:hypothetical protein
MDFWMKMIKREFDTKPIACHLYVTDQCNLDCFYCTEYDNSIPHPSLEDLKKWLRKIKELGCIRIGLQGGGTITTPGYRPHCTVLQGIGFEHQYGYEWVYAHANADSGPRECWSGFDAGLC